MRGRLQPYVKAAHSRLAQEDLCRVGSKTGRSAGAEGFGAESGLGRASQLAQGWVDEFSARRDTSHVASDCCAAALSSSACHSMAAVLTPCASSAARSPGMRETTQICGRRESMPLVRRTRLRSRSLGAARA